MDDVLLTRDEFRKQVFERDNYKCVIKGCEKEAKDAHHLLERRLFEDEGYYLANGVSLCEEHHLLAEQTILNCSELRLAAGIDHILLPLHFYADYEYSKWGDIILNDGRRVKGELFYDSSVQKILKEGRVLDQYCSYVKYPRTMHFPWSKGATDDDRILQDTKHFEGKQVVVSTKLDGECTTMYRDYIHARSIEGDSHASQSWVRNLHSKISYDIPEGWRICGENLYAKHTIEYANLKSYFQVFSIWNEKNECLNWADTCEWASLLDLITVPVLYIGLWDEALVKSLYKEMYNNDRMEGYVVRLYDSFLYRQFRYAVAKYVDRQFKEELKDMGFHWRYKPFKVNKIKV